MASVCAASLALHQAGIPLKNIVAGLSLGLVAGKTPQILTDITGEEDALGEMDLKIAGTREGITAVHLDLKSPCLSLKVFQQALDRSKIARLKILDCLEEQINQTNLPSIETFSLPENTLRAGRKLKKISQKTQSVIVMNKQKLIIWSATPERKQLNQIFLDYIFTQPKIGDLYACRIEKVNQFGVFVKVKPGFDSFLHQSKLLKERNSEDVSEKIFVKIVAFDQQGKIKLEEIPENNQIQNPLFESWMD
jgi:polyribonucleotide nucleotidyltransferase